MKAVMVILATWLLLSCIPASYGLPSQRLTTGRAVVPRTIRKAVTAKDDAVKTPLQKKGSLLDSIPDGVKNGIASGLAAALVKTFLQPLDTIKTVQQGQRMGLNPIAAIRKVIERGGVGGLWAGVAVTVLGSSPSVALYFGAYSSCKRYLTTVMPDEAYLLAVALAASIGNTFASFLRVPYEVLKQRMQNGDHASTMEALRYAAQNDGMIGLFTGGKLYSQILRDVPYAIVTLVSYEVLQALVTRYRASQQQQQKQKQQSNATTSAKKKAADALCGALAGGLGSIASTPMDVVKTRMMLGGGGYSGVTDCVTRMLKEEGAGSFFIGTGPRLLHKIPANGLFFLTYEFFRTLLKVEVRA
jgi:solute carrier family 25 S-adenosylmethionine transporter 26